MYHLICYSLFWTHILALGICLYSPAYCGHFENLCIESFFLGIFESILPECIAYCIYILNMFSIQSVHSSWMVSLTRLHMYLSILFDAYGCLFHFTNNKKRFVHFFRKQEFPFRIPWNRMKFSKFKKIHTINEWKEFN